MSKFFIKTVTIANGASLSSAADLNAGDSSLDEGVAIVGILMPAAWTAAQLTLQASDNDVDYRNVYDADGVEVTLEAAASRHIRLPVSLWAGFRFVKIRSGPGAVPINQGAARDIKILYREV